MTAAEKHETLGYTDGAGDPTSGVEAIDRFCAALQREREQRLATNAALPLSTLARVRFGRMERWWLLRLSAKPLYLVATGSRAAVESAGRARRKLMGLGLVGWYAGYYLLPLGQKVVERFKSELEAGQRIRWPR